MNSPTITDAPPPSQPDDQTGNPYAGSESSGLQNFKPDEDAAKAQLAQYAGKKVVYFDTPPSRDGDAGDSASSKLQGQMVAPKFGSEEQSMQQDQGNGDGQQSHGSPSSPSHRNNQDDVLPIGQIRGSNGPQSRPGKPLGTKLCLQFF